MVNVLAWPGFENKTGNPYTRLLYEAVEQHGVTVQDFSLRRALEGGFDLWHVHWPDDFLSYPSPWTAVAYVAAELVLMAQARCRGARLVWTIHDLGPHESPHPWLERLFWPLFLPMVDGYITLSEHAREAARQRFPSLQAVPGAVVPHGHYRPAYPPPVPKARARAEWDLPPEDPVIAFFGRIRPYKNVEALVSTFLQLAGDTTRLLIAGNPSEPALADRIRAMAADHPRVHLILRFLDEQEIPTVLGAADLVALPYADILHSGSALLALSFDRPVLVPAQGAMGELRRTVGDEWVYTYRDALRPTDLRTALQAARTEDRPSRAPLEDLSWDLLAERTVALYERVVGAGPETDRSPHRHA